MLINREKSSHWYYKDGTPCYSIPCKNGNGDRAVRKTDAIKLELLPSITTITSLLANPGLEAWKQEQCILSALTLPKNQDETLEQFAHRVVEDSANEGKAAAAFGTDVHNYIENYIMKKQQDMFTILDTAPEIKKGIDEWLLCQVFDGMCEEIKTNDIIGAAGKIDYVGLFNSNRCIVDFKTQKTRPDTAVNAYQTWLYQLCGYRLVMGEDHRLVNIIISTTEPRRIEIKEWTDEDIEKGQRIFTLLRALFREIKGC